MLRSPVRVLLSHHPPEIGDRHPIGAVCDCDLSVPRRSLVVTSRLKGSGLRLTSLRLDLGPYLCQNVVYLARLVVRLSRLAPPIHFPPRVTPPSQRCAFLARPAFPTPPSARRPGSAEKVLYEFGPAIIPRW